MVVEVSPDDDLPFIIKEKEVEDDSELPPSSSKEEEEEEEEMTFTIPFTSDGPIPIRPILILFLVTTMEGATQIYILPFIVFQVEWMGIPEKSAGYYVGILTTSYYLAQFLNSAFYGKLSDYIGRKPIFLNGFACTCLCSVLLGFCTTFPMAVAVRFCQGLVNGDIPMIKSYVRDCSTEKNMARVYSFRIVGVSTGLVLGPLIGGSFSDPSKNWPDLFPSSSLFGTYPYLLPCLILGILNFMTFLLCLMFMKESLSNPPPLFVGLRRFLISVGLGKFFSLVQQDGHEDGVVLKELNQEEEEEEEDFLPPPLSEQDEVEVVTKTKESRTIRLLKEPFISLAILLYATFACVSVIFSEIFSLWAVHSVQNQGLGFLESDIGVCLAVGSLGGLLFCFFFFPPLNQKCGSLLLWKISVSFGSFFYLFLPLLSRLVQISRSWTILLLYLAFICQRIHLSVGYSTIDLIIANLAPIDSIGSVAGVASTCSTLAAVLSPLFGGALFAQTAETSLPWPFGTSTAFTFLGFICFCLLLGSMFLRQDEVEKRRTTPLDHQEAEN